MDVNEPEIFLIKHCVYFVEKADRVSVGVILKIFFSKLLLVFWFTVFRRLYLKFKISVSVLFVCVQSS